MSKKKSKWEKYKIEVRRMLEIRSIYFKKMMNGKNGNLGTRNFRQVLPRTRKNYELKKKQ